MPENDPPSEEEIDVFMELYEEHGTKKAVAERVQWSRPTVSKWIDRRLEEQDEEEDDTEDTMEQDTADTPETDVSDSRETDRGVPDDLIEEPKSPNEILLEIIDRDPKLGDDEATYIEQFFADYGQLSPQDVTSILQDLSINNKRMTISRITRHYERAINQRLREDRDLMYDQRWATLLTKVTGDRHYIEQAQSSMERDTGLGGITPPAPAGESQPGRGGGGSGINPPSPEPSEKRHNGNRAWERPGANSDPQPSPEPQPQGRPQGNNAAFAGPQGQPSGQDGLSPFEERLLEMLEDQMSDDDEPAPGPEPSSPTDQIQELVELQQKMEQLQSAGDGQSDEIAEQFNAVIEQMNERMERLERQIAQQDSEPTPQPQTGDTGFGNDSMLGEIAMLAERIDDPEMISMLVETQTDPEVLEARAKSKEVENETEWKKAIAESLSPQATEKAMEVVSNLTSNLSNPQAVTPQPRQQPQQPRQPAQQQTQREQRDVAVVDEGDQPQNGSREQAAEQQEDVSSPLREEVEQEIDAAEVAEDEAESEAAEGESPAEDGNTEEEEE